MNGALLPGSTMGAALVVAAAGLAFVAVETPGFGTAADGGSVIVCLGMG